jgi:methionyl-tRNA synthetase
MSELTHPGSESRARSKFYLTTPIYYVNARPHIGHAYTTIVADVLARRHRLLGDDTFFLTGTDEHGQKIERSAAAAGIAPQEFTDQVSATFREPWLRMGLTYDDFIRTTEPRHQRGVQKLFKVLEENGFIYLDTYTGQYCITDEAYVDGPPGVVCPDCGNVTETISESNYYFRLSAFEQKILELIETNAMVIEPATLRNEVLSFVRSGLKDLSISRTSITWGIPVPGHPEHVIYVWLDALANYMTAVGYGSDAPEDMAKFEHYWPADLHLIGKEIARFHCVYWPAFLMAADLPLPKKIAANGWLLFHDSKMSKSKGNVVRIETILDGFGEQVYKKQFPDSTKKEQDLFAADVLRYFLLREIPFGQDGSFTFEAMVTRYNADLANGYGNLVSRTLAMIQKYFDGVIPAGAVQDGIAVAIREAEEAAPRQFDALDFAGALQTTTQLVRAADSYITLSAPWKLAADETRRGELSDVLYTVATCIAVVSKLLLPVLPFTVANVLGQLGTSVAVGKSDAEHLAGTKLGALAPIFPRAEKTLPQWMADVEAARVVPTSMKISEEKVDAMPTVDESQTPAEPKTHPAAPLKDEGDPLDPVDGPGYKPNRPAPAEVPMDSTDPGAAPRTSAMAEPNPMAQVAGAAAGMPDLVKTPSHTEAQASGAFATSAAGSGIPDTPTIAIDDFVKVDLRVAKILVAERIPKADKLLRLEVDLGYEQRQILSGIAEWYTPEELIGRKIVIIANLAPRKMRGLESKGMLLAASEGENGRPVLATFGEEIAVGTRLR